MCHGNGSKTMTTSNTHKQTYATRQDGNCHVSIALCLWFAFLALLLPLFFSFIGPVIQLGHSLEGR